VAGLLSGPVKELDETAEATVEATMEDADLYMCTRARELIVSPVLKHYIVLCLEENGKMEIIFKSNQFSRIVFTHLNTFELS
jgi:hypothetical protein